MIASLIKKDLLRLAGRRKAGRFDWLSFLLNLLIIAFLSAVFSVLLLKVHSIRGNEEGIFAYADASFLSIALFAITICYGVALSPKAGELLFDKGERKLINPLPIPFHKLFAAKLGALLVKAVGDYCLLAYGFFLAYGIINGVALPYYFLSFLSSLLLSFFVAFLAVLLAYPAKAIGGFFRGHLLAEVVAVILLSGAIGTVYFLFVRYAASLVSANQVSSILNVQAMGILSDTARFLIPTSAFIQLSLWRFDLASFLPGITLFLLGIALLPYFVRVCLRAETDEQPSKRKSSSLARTYAGKEFIRTSRGGNLVFSYLSLMVLIPLFAYFFAYLLSSVFDSLGLNALSFPATGNFLLDRLLSSLPELIVPLIEALLFLFIPLCFYSSTPYFALESQSFKVLLSLPKSMRKQLNAKLLLGYLSLVLALVLSAAVLLASNLLGLTDTLNFLLVAFFLSSTAFLFGKANDLRALSGRRGNGYNPLSIVVFSILYLLLDLLLLMFLPDLKTPGRLFIEPGLFFLLFLLSWFGYRNDRNAFIKTIETNGGLIR